MRSRIKSVRRVWKTVRTRLDPYGFIIHACWFNLIAFPGDVSLISAYMIFTRFQIGSMRGAYNFIQKPLESIRVKLPPRLLTMALPRRLTWLACLAVLAWLTPKCNSGDPESNPYGEFEKPYGPVWTHMGFIIHACWFNLITFPGDVSLISAYMIFTRFQIGSMRCAYNFIQKPLECSRIFCLRGCAKRSPMTTVAASYGMVAVRYYTRFGSLSVNFTPDFFPKCDEHPLWKRCSRCRF